MAPPIFHVNQITGLIMKPLLKSMFLLAVLGIFVFASTSRAGQVLVNGMAPDFPPFAYLDKDNRPVGFDVEVLTQIGKDLGLSVEHKIIGYRRLIPELLAGRIDVIASGLRITPKRSQKAAFCEPTWSFGQVFVVRPDSSLTAGQMLSGGLVLGVQRGTTEADWLEGQASKKGAKFKIEKFDMAEEALEAVRQGVLDAAIMDGVPAEKAASDGQARIVGPIGMEAESYAFAVRLADQSLRDRLNQGLRQFKTRPLFGELVRKYKLDR